MDINLIGSSVGVLSGLAIVSGGMLSYASKRFHVDVDPKIEEIEAALPGLNCGICGNPGCFGFAELVAGGKAPVDGCKPGAGETALAIAKIMGVEVEVGIPQKAYLLCRGGYREDQHKAKYSGHQSCKMANMLGGDRNCGYGCLGYGDCVAPCPFNAIEIDRNGLPVIDKDLCTGCGACVEACPRGTLGLIPENATPWVACRSHDNAKMVRQVCSLDPKTIIGCTGCKMCQKVCEYEAIDINDNLAIIDPEKCTNCGKCVEKCPTKCILARQLPLPQTADAVSAEEAVAG